MTVLAVIICLLVCVLPVWCRALYILFYYRENGVPPSLYPMLEISLHWLLFSHSSINPCIYGLINPQFQEAFKNILFFFSNNPAYNKKARRCTYGDSITANEAKNRLSQKRFSSVYSVENSVKEKNTSAVHHENILHDISCSILRNNNTFLGLKFSKIDSNGAAANLSSTSQPGMINVSENMDSEHYFESVVQTTTEV